MSEAEFDTHEKMMNYNPEYERKRKELAEAQLNRSKEEVQEETYLLEELKRIVMNERQFVEDRKELYARLETPPSTGNTNMYQTSQGLNNLLSNLMAADKSRKRRSLLGTESLLSPVSPMVPQSQQQAGRDSKPPETPSTATGPTTTTTKKGGSAAAAAAAVQPQHQIKQLTAAEKLKYGVSQHERLTSGVHFRNDKAVKLTQAKSNIQTQKLAAALTELEIPPRLVMPTEKVVKEFEKLIQQVNLLLDARKVSDKIEGEIKILEAAKAERERKEKEKAEGTETQAEPAGEPKPAESPNREGANKRSASAMGTPDEKAGGNKKQKK
ncbi:swr complex subunit [Ascosphaera atra]|nr:swr complex subunit [Ascosphaera atra]